MTFRSHNRIPAKSREAAQAALWRPTGTVCMGVVATTPVRIGTSDMLMLQQGGIKPERFNSDYRHKSGQ